MPYSAADIIGKTLYAASQVPIVRLPFDDQIPLRFVDRGQIVGVVWTYFEPKPGRSTLYWGFKDPYGNEFYAPHRSEYYDTQKLRDQGVLTTEEKEAAKDPLASTAKSLLTTGLLFWGAIQLGKEYIRKKA